MSIQDILKKDDTVIIDVREPYEFMTDRVYDAVNMPLSKFGEYIDEIKNMKGNKVFYCRSGNRSGQAVNYLQSIGVKDVHNGGSLMLMQSYVLA